MRICDCCVSYTVYARYARLHHYLHSVWKVVYEKYTKYVWLVAGTAHAKLQTLGRLIWMDIRLWITCTFFFFFWISSLIDYRFRFWDWVILKICKECLDIRASFPPTHHTLSCLPCDPMLHLCELFYREREKQTLSAHFSSTIKVKGLWCRADSQ